MAQNEAEQQTPDIAVWFLGPFYVVNRGFHHKPNWTGQVQCWMQFDLSAEQVSGCSVLLTRSGIQCFLLSCVLEMQLFKGSSPRESEESWIVDQMCPN